MEAVHHLRPSESLLAAQHGDGEDDEDQAEHGGGAAVERPPILHVDGSGEGVVAEHRHRAEVTQGVEGHEKRPAGERGPQLGENDPEQCLSAGAAEHTARLFKCWIEPAPRGANGE